MLFNSLDFAVFFPLVAALYFLLPHRLRWVQLLAASCWFYMVWRPAYILIVLFTTAIDYVAALQMEGREDGQTKRALLATALGGNLLVLSLFKYFDFFAANVTALVGLTGHPVAPPKLGLVLPLGISFHTFQAMSYAIDVYKGRVRAERHLGIYFLYVIFFPQLVAGPIERAGGMLPQFREVHTFDFARVLSGLKLMAWGLFKKAVIADRLGVYVDRVYSDPHSWRGPPLIVATVFFAYQIYGDFSGYSDMAIGAAEVLGFRLSTNFRQPYSAASIGEFWRRWHITLSTWFKDYVYIPLGGNRGGLARQCANLFVTFLLSGLWHGASWTFVAWGAVNGGYLVASRLTAGARARLLAATGLENAPSLVGLWSRWSTFALTCVAWVFFRARTLQDATWVLRHATDWPGSSLAAFRGSPALGAEDPTLDLAAGVAAIVFLELVHAIQERSPETLRARLARRPIAVRFLVYWLIAFALVFFGRFENRQFIYFEF